MNKSFPQEASDIQAPVVRFHGVNAEDIANNNEATTINALGIRMGRQTPANDIHSGQIQNHYDMHALHIVGAGTAAGGRRVIWSVH